MQSPPFQCWAGSPPDPPANCEPRIHGTPVLPWWKYLYTMLKAFRALLCNTQQAMLSMVLYNGARDILKHQSCNMMYLSHEKQHAMELCIYHGIEVQGEGLKGEHISHVCQWIGSKSWCGGDQQNNSVWVNQSLGRYYSTLNWCLQWQLQWLFKIKILINYVTLLEYWLALALTTIPHNPGNLDTVSKLVQSSTALAAVVLQVVSMENIVSWEHTIPEIATSGMAGARRNERWIIIIHIDLLTWNNVYN